MSIISVFLLFYINLIYPAVLLILSKLFKSNLAPDDKFVPNITIIISAYNEEKYITDAINSILNSDYPLEKIKIIAGSDGSADKTAELIKSMMQYHSNIELYEFERSGKNKILNELVKKTSDPFIFFMDADLRLKADTLSISASYFADRNVGGVMSKVVISMDQEDENIGVHGESVYQRYETFIRRKETEISTSVNSLGTLYGLRKELIEEIPNDFVCDDLFYVLTVAVRKKKLVFLDKSVVTEVREKSLGEEMKRRVRLAAGGISTIKSRLSLLSPSFGWSWFFFVSHKVMRYFLPIILIILAVCTLVLAFEGSVFITVLIAGQLIFYLLAFLGWILEKIGIKISLFRIFTFFLTMNIGFLLGWIRVILRGQNSAWERIDTRKKQS